jgi:hypothetical protein
MARRISMPEIRYIGNSKAEIMIKGYFKKVTKDEIVKVSEKEKEDFMKTGLFELIKDFKKGGKEK